MYFKDKEETNIDNEFNNKNIISKLLKIINQYKLFIIIGLILIVSMIIIFIFLHNKTNYYLELIGDTEITIYQGTDYVEYGYKAYNSKNVDLNNKVIIKSTLDTNNIGKYEINYKLNDIELVRNINVIKKPEEYTYIYLNTVNNSPIVYLKVDEEYVEPGYTVFNSISSDLTNSVEIEGKVDPSKKGTYRLIYSVKDSNNVLITAVRTIIVMDTEVSLSLNTNEYTNNNVTINIGVVDNYYDYMILPDNTKITTKTYKYEVNKNGTYTFKFYNTKGIEKEKSIEVKNIDKDSPTGSCSGTYGTGQTIITVSAKDNIGISKYEVNNKSYTNNKITLSEDLSEVNVTIYDIAGNQKTIKCNLENKKITYNKEFSVNYYNSTKGKGLSYWLYIPQDATNNMPLIVYLHGTEGKGNDYKNNTKLAIQHGPGNDINRNHKEYKNVIMLMPQTRENSYLNMDEIMELIDYIANKYEINKNKISLSGMSEGAYEISTKIGDYANYFSSIVLLGNYVNNPEKFTSTSVITMCGELDSARNYSMQQFVNKINELGGNATHYTIKGLEHNIVGSQYSVFRDEKYQLVEWMIKQTKKS